MNFIAEPALSEDEPPRRTAVLLVNLGTPDAPTPAALRRYLGEFLSDPRVVEIPRVVWWPILHGIVLRTRPAKSAAKYRSVWLPEGSPLAVWTQAQADALAQRLAAAGRTDVVVRHAMRYGNPALPAVLDGLRTAGATRIVVLPLYPQHCAATTASTFDAVAAWAQRRRRMPELRFVADYHDDAGYIGALAATIQRHWQQHGRADKLLLSFHGVPLRGVQQGDPYEAQCRRTARLLAERLALDDADAIVTFQSRFGRARWLEPATEPTLQALAAQGVRSVDVACPGFAADCLETLEEIAQEARDAFIAAGGQRFGYVPCLNVEPEWVDALTALVQRQLQGWPP